MPMMHATTIGITFFLLGMMRSIIPVMKRGDATINPSGFRK
jgi:hypothetical protein